MLPFLPCKSSALKSNKVQLELGTFEKEKTYIGIQNIHGMSANSAHLCIFLFFVPTKIEVQILFIGVCKCCLSERALLDYCMLRKVAQSTLGRHVRPIKPISMTMRLMATDNAIVDQHKQITQQLQKQTVGIQFPVDAKGARSTTAAGKLILAAALRGTGTATGTEFAAAVDGEKDWRFNYQKHFMNLVRVSASRCRSK